jgi:hypothetical protein
MSCLRLDGNGDDPRGTVVARICWNSPVVAGNRRDLDKGKSLQHGTLRRFALLVGIIEIGFDSRWRYKKAPAARAAQQLDTRRARL